jgi:hypothetical protein
MFKTLRHSATAFVTLSLAFLPGCSAQKSATDVASDGVAKASRPTFSLNTPVHVIAADQRGKAVLDRDVPGLMASRSYLLFEDMSLSQIATVSSGQLTKAKLDRVEADLAQLSTDGKTGQ